MEVQADRFDLVLGLFDFGGPFLFEDFFRIFPFGFNLLMVEEAELPFCF